MNKPFIQRATKRLLKRDEDGVTKNGYQFYEVPFQITK